MTVPTPGMNAKPRTRIQREKTAAILEAALDVFSAHGFRGSTIDMIAEAAGLSKPNVLYYFSGKEEMHTKVLERLLQTWLDPMVSMNPDGEPLDEIRQYVQRKLEMARLYPRESRLFASEILLGAPNIEHVLRGELSRIVDEQAELITRWVDEGKLAEVHPKHLIFSIWATTQHYADFSAQVSFVLGQEEDPFDGASAHLDRMFTRLLTPRNLTA